MLSVENLECRYGKVAAVRGLSLEVKCGELVSLIGANGAGKTTTLKAISGVLRAAGGRIAFEGEDITHASARRILALGIAHCPEGRHVFPYMTVRENLEMGGYVDPKGSRRRIDEIFARFPALADKRRHAARTLSGGQRQMLAMAMALMVAPALLLLDEPSAGLAPRAAEQLFDTVAAVNRDGVAIVMVEQNALEALSIAHRAVVLVDGRTAREGDAKEIAGDAEVRRLFLGA